MENNTYSNSDAKNISQPIAKIVLFVFSFLILGWQFANAINYVSVTSGLWTSSSTWSPASPSGGPGQVAGDNVIIADGTTVTYDKTPNLGNVLSSLQIGQGTSGVLQFYNNATSQNMSISGNVTVMAGAIFQANPAATVNGTHTMTLTGTSITNNGTINFKITTGSFTSVINVTTGVGTPSYSGSGTNLFNNFTMNSSGTFTMNADMNLAGVLAVNASTSWIVNGKTLTISGIGTAVTNGGTFTGTALGSKLLLNAAGAQTLSSAALSVDNLTVNSPGFTVTQSTALTIGSNLTITAGTLAATSSITATTASTSITGTLLVNGGGTDNLGSVTFPSSTSGTVSITAAAKVMVNSGDLNIGTGNSWTNSTTAATAVQVVNGSLNVSGTGTFSNNALATPCSISGNITVASTATFTPGTGVWTLTGASKTIGGTVTSLSFTSMTVNGSYTIGGSVATLTVATALSGSGTLQMGANTTLNIGGTSAITTLDCTTNTPNTVVYNSTSAAQTLKGNMTYYNLTVSKSGILAGTVGTGAITVNGNLSVTAGALNDGGFTITGTATGTFSISSGATFTTLQLTAPFYPVNFGTTTIATINTINFYGNGTFTLPGPPPVLTNFYNLGIGGTGTKISNDNPLTAANNVTITQSTGPGTLALNYGISTPTFTGGSSVTLDIEDGGGASNISIPTITGGLGKLIINRAAGVTLGAPLTLAGTSGSFALGLTNGVLNTTSTNLLTVTSVFASAINGGSVNSFVNGPMVLTLQVSLSAGTQNYQFPFGDINGPSYDPLWLLGPSTTSGSSATIQAQLFSGNAGGTAGPAVTSLNTNRYWNATVLTNASSITTIGQIELIDPTVVFGNVICNSTTQTGTYNAIASNVAGTVVITNSTGPASLGYFVIGTINSTFNFNGLTVGTGGTFPSLTNAGGLFATINAVGSLQGNSNVSIISDLTAATEGGTGETGANALNAFASGFTLTVQPSNTTLRTISGTGVATGAPLIAINGASNVTFDGSSGGSGQYLLFRNTNSTATNTGATFQIGNATNGATNCTIKNCMVENNASTSNRGAIMLGVTGTNTTGILITGNNISGATADNIGNVANGIYTGGTTTTFTASANNIFNFSVTGISLQGAGNGSQVTGNSIYQTANIVSTVAMTGINVQVSGTATGGELIQGNFIGGNASALTGGAISGVWNYTSSTSTFFGIQIFANSSAAVNVIKGNTIGGISFVTSLSATSAPGIFTGIYVQGGLVNIGGALASDGNTIGNAGTAPITVTPSVTGDYAAGIYMTSVSGNTIQNNKITAINCKGSTAALASTFNGINTASSGAITLIGNTIGVSTLNANDIIIGSATTTAALTINGILCANTNANNIIQGNIVQGITALTTGAITFNGISVSGSGSFTISASNTIGSSSVNSLLIGTTASPVTAGALIINGILATNTGASTIQTNSIQNITGTTTGAITSFNGISATATTTANALTIGGNPPAALGNTISNLTEASTATTTILRGISVSGLLSTTSLTIQGNTISTLQSTTANAGTGSGGAIIGILSNLAQPNQTIDQNTISGLAATNTAAAAVTVDGITVASLGGSGNITRNKVFSLTNTNAAASLPVISGIHVAGGNITSPVWTVANNMVSMTSTDGAVVSGIFENSSDAASYYFNTVYIGGTTSTNKTYAFQRNSANANILVKNNIFMNNRAGASKDYAIGEINTLATNWPATASDYNILNSAGTIAFWGPGSTQNQTFAQWKAAQTAGSGGDSHSQSGVSLTFANTATGDLHISTPSPAAGAAINGTGVLNDFDNLTRSTLSPPQGPTIGANELPACAAPAITPSTTPVTCNGGSNGTITLSTTGGTSPFTYAWSNGATTSSLNSISAATYTVTVTASGGCTVTASATVTQPTAVSASSAVNGSILCHGGTTTVTVTAAGGGTAPYSGTGIFTVGAGGYSFVITDAAGCTALANGTITEPPALSVSPSSNSPVCATDSINLISTVGGGTGNYQYSWTGPVAFSSTNVNPVLYAATTAYGGTYAVTVTDANNCSATTTTNVSVTNCRTVLNLKLLIQGYYLGSGQMQAVMLNEGISGATAAQTDTILVELHNTTNTATVIESQQAILMTDGSATATFSGAVTDSIYWVAVKHRNAIQTWTAAPLTFNPINSYNFTPAATQAYGDNQVQIDFSPDLYAFYSGDLNQDLNIDLIDFPSLDFGINNGLFGYYAADLNGDGNVDLLDFPVLDANINAGIFSHHP